MIKDFRLIAKAPKIKGLWGLLEKAGDETRTHDIQLGKLTFYH